MRFRAGLVIGLATGYYFGAKAGRERYLQIRQNLRRLRGSAAFGAASHKAKAVVDLGVERAKDIIDLRHTPEPAEDAAVAGSGPSLN